MASKEITALEDATVDISERSTMAQREIPKGDELRKQHPGNSYAERASGEFSKASNQAPSKSKTDISDSPEERPKATQVSTAKKVRKQSAFRKVASSIIEDSFENVKERAIGEVIVPGLKSLIFDSAMDMLDAMLFGASNSGPRNYSYSNSRVRGPRQGDRTSYSQYYDRNGYSAPRKAPREDYGGYSMDPDDIIVATRMEANKVLGEVDKWIQRYGSASIAVYYDAVGLTADWTDNQYGWYSLKGAQIRHVRDGYLIVMPPTHELE